MCIDLTPAQQELASFMSQLSERAYRAQWMLNLEVELWLALHAPDGRTVPHNLTPTEVALLRSMGEACGGWIASDHVSGLVFVPMKEWLLRAGTGARG